MEAGEFPVGRERNFIGLQVSDPARPIALHGDEVVGVQTSDRRFIRIADALWAGFESPVRDEVLIPWAQPLGAESPVRTECERTVVQLTWATE